VCAHLSLNLLGERIVRCLPLLWLSQILVLEFAFLSPISILMHPQFVITHIGILFAVALFFGLLSIFTHKVGKDSHRFGALIILFPAFAVALFYTLFFDAPRGFSHALAAFNGYWWLFLIYSPLVLLSNQLRTVGFFHNNLTSTSILINLSVIFAALIETALFSNKMELTFIAGVILLFWSAYLVHSGHITFSRYSWFIVAHCFLAAINRNIDYYMILDGIDIFSILLVQEVIIIPAILVLNWQKINNHFRFLLNDRPTLYAMLCALVAIPLSMKSAQYYGPSETLLAISIGMLLSGLIENAKTRHLSHLRSLVVAIMALASVCLMVF